MLRKSVFSLGLAAMLAACTPDPPATSAMDAEAKRFQASPGMGAIYVLRGADRFYLYGVPVSVDGQRMGLIARDGYARSDVTPGRHRILCGEGETPHVVDVAAGQLVFLEALPQDGLVSAPRCTMLTLDDLNGRERVSASQRSVPRG